jgi:PAS domain S-box-containing protein
MSQIKNTLPADCAAALGNHLFENSPDCLKLLDGDDRIVTMNRSGRAAMAIEDLGQVQGRAWRDLWPREAHAGLDAALAQARREGSARFSGACPTLAGTPKWWDVRISALPAADGAPVQLIAVSQDVTAAHGMRGQFAGDARYDSLVAATAAIIWKAGSNGECDGEQPAWAAFTGQDFGAYQGWGWLDAVHPDDRDVTAAAWRRAVEAGSAYLGEHRLRRADGAWRHMSVRAVPVPDPQSGGAVREWIGVHTDVTALAAVRGDRERLLKELQAAHQRMSEVFMRAPAFMCVLSGPEHVFEFANDRYRELVGERRLLGLPAEEAVPELAPQGLIAMLDRVYASGEAYAASDLQVQLQRTAGAGPELRYLDLVFIALRDADGSVTGLLGHGVDQTHRKLAEIGLHDSRERFQKIVSQAATGVVEMDVNGTVTFVNGRFCAMLGYDESELLGHSILDVTAPDSVEKTALALGGLLATGEGFQMDKHYRRKDGTLMPATSSVNAVRGASGEYRAVVAIVLDTTESKRAAEALRASQERYRKLFESMDQAFAILELDFDGAGRAVDWTYLETNPAFTAQTGLADAVGKTMRSMVSEPEAWWLDELGAVARSGQARRFEHEARAGGRWLDVYMSRIGGADSRTSDNRVAVLFRDISERKQAEATLRRLADDLAEADRRKTEFLATLAHELRNPLAPIRSGLGVMRLNRELPAGMTRVREMMERQVTHMVHLIDDLLDVARISGGKLNLRMERVALNGVLASAVETSLPLIEAAHHELALDLPDATLLVDGDATRIAQVVSNLLNNAAKYTPAGGRIGLELRAEDGQAVITVTDTGIGIPGHALDSVFEMFSQVGSGAERAQGGLGIGLSLVRQLVRMHGGSVEAHSGGAGSGSRFTVRLPLADSLAAASPGSAAAAPAQPDSESASLRVLVVDDNVDAALTLSMILDIEGYATRVAHSGPEALDVAAAFRPSVVFLDIGMPGMDGYETAAALRRLAAIETPCLVALTGWGAEHDRARSREAGFDHHLTKPVDLGTVQTLLADMNAAANSGRPPCSNIG